MAGSGVAIPDGIHDEASEAALRELWISFTSLVRSYVAMLQVVHGEPAAEVAAFDVSRFEVRSPRRVLRMQLAPGSAEGSWSLDSTTAPLVTGAFRLLPDGRVEWSGLPQPAEMDVIAETVATMMAED